MAQTYLQLQNSSLGDDFDAAKYRDEAKQAINDALDDIARQARVPQLEKVWTPTVVAGTATYAPPTDMVRLLSIFDAGSHQQLVDVGQEAIDQSPAASGRPSSFAETAGQVVLYPTPDKTYSITGRYLSDATNLVGDSDTSAAIPDSYAYAVICFARARLFAKEDDAEMSDFWLGRYERELGRIKGDLGRRDRSRVRRVPGRRGMAQGAPRFQRP